MKPEKILKMTCPLPPFNLRDLGRLYAHILSMYAYALKHGGVGFIPRCLG